MKLGNLKMDLAKVESGLWIDNIPDMGELRLKVRPIGSVLVEDQGDRGQCVPNLNAFIGVAMVKRDLGGYISLTSYSNARKIDPVAVLPDGSKMYAASYWSSYA